MLNQAGGDRQILAKQLGISPHQLSYVTHSSEGEGLLFYGCLLYTSTVLNRLISRILVGEVKKVDGQKVQEVRIVYNFVGEICGEKEK